MSLRSLRGDLGVELWSSLRIVETMGLLEMDRMYFAVKMDVGFWETRSEFYGLWAEVVAQW